MGAEKSFENRIKNYLKAHGCWYVKYFANRMTRIGVPDILACVNGFFVGIEVKSENGKASDLQLWNRDEIRNAGGISIIVYPDQWEDFQLLIQDLISYPKHIDTIRTEQQTFDERG